MKYKIFLSVGALLAALALSMSSGSVSAKSVKPVFDKKEYNEFFWQLSESERTWIMDLAVWYYDADKPYIGPFPIDRDLFKPVPSNDTGDLVPNTLVFQFLNGDVPKGFQKEFNQWLSITYGLTKKNYEQYKATGVFCTDQDTNCDLVNLKNIGGICCPFG